MRENATRNIVFVLLDGFPVLGLAGAMEVYRHANRFGGGDHYITRMATADGGHVQASNGLRIVPDFALADVPTPHAIMVLAGFDAERIDDARFLSTLRSRVRPGVLVGGISNGAFVLARAGLLDGYRCTVHWEDFASFCELFPRVRPLYQRYVRHGERVTCSGGTSTIDLFLELIAEDLGRAVATRVSQQMMVRDRYPGNESQTHALSTGGRPLSPAVAHAMMEMEKTLDTPKTVAELANAAGITRRHLLRLFQRELGIGPQRFSIKLRLDRARSLVLHTHLGLADIAAATGFSSHSHFIRSYRKTFEENPSQTRRHPSPTTPVGRSQGAV